MVVVGVCCYCLLFFENIRADSAEFIAPLRDSLRRSPSTSEHESEKVDGAAGVAGEMRCSGQSQGNTEHARSREPIGTAVNGNSHDAHSVHEADAAVAGGAGEAEIHLEVGRVAYI